ncbi:MAG TPA: MerR family transcriptional regulator [Acidimicrobiales bacterium]|nr:MerR family transcriptional regulator [Acidimicrobiales bacterium]
MTQIGPQPEPEPGPWTIDELAVVAGTTSRNLRAFQSRGLLPPPRLVGRTGHYDDGHRRRLDAILGLQRRGYSLAAIADLAAAWERGGTLEEVLGFETPVPRRRSGRGWGGQDRDVIFLDDLRQWRVPRGSGLALLPEPVLRS